MLGTGPLAETFPEPLGTLESDLWLAPLSEGLEQALLLTGTASTRALRRRPVVRDIDGWAVADLGHLGVAPGAAQAPAQASIPGRRPGGCGPRGAPGG